MGMGSTCFMSGARVRAARGEIPVDEIEPGDEVVVIRHGQETLEPVKWVGHTYVDIARYAYPEEAAPIRFVRGAIADNQPVRDLVVSPEHCLVLDGLCVPAKLLVNGGSIVSERGRAPFTYYHIELERHGILLAENTPTESYLDTGNRSTFDNAEEPRQLYPSFNVDEGHIRWATDACAPLAKVPEEVEPIWARLAERSVRLGYALPVIETVGDPALHLVADGQIIQPISDRDGRYTFAVPAGVSSVTLKSLYCIPADKMTASQRDTRRLGMRVSWIAIRSSDGDTVIPADHPGLEDGWNGVEKDAQSIWRWTDGAASIPWQSVSGSAVITVRCFPVDRYPASNEQTRLVA